MKNIIHSVKMDPLDDFDSDYESLGYFDNDEEPMEGFAEEPEKHQEKTIQIPSLIGLSEMNLEVLKRVNDDDLHHLCETNRYFLNLCQSNPLLIERLKNIKESMRKQYLSKHQQLIDKQHELLEKYKKIKKDYDKIHAENIFWKTITLEKYIMMQIAELANTSKYKKSKNKDALERDVKRDAYDKYYYHQMNPDAKEALYDYELYIIQTELNKINAILRKAM